MFKAIGKFFGLITINLDTLCVFSNVGNLYAKQFESQADLELRKAQHTLRQQETLFLSTVTPA